MGVWDRLSAANIPFAPRRWPFFYGWMIVVVGTLGMLASSPGQTIGVGVFTDDLMAVLGLNRVHLSQAYMVGTIGSSLLLPLAGTLLDRIGARAMGAISCLGLALSLVVLSRVDQLAAWMGEDSVSAAMAAALLGFLLIRFMGQGCLTMTCRVMISKWFDHRRGLAMAINGMFVTFGFSVAPQVFNALTNAYGWRGASLILAVVLCGTMTVIAWIFGRDNPEQCGLVMDGVDDPAWRARMAQRVPETRKEFTRVEAMKTFAFWIFNVALGTQALIVTAVAFHIASLGDASGLDRDRSYAVFLPMAVCSVLANLLAGWACDRIRLKWLMMLMLMGQSVGTLGLLNFSRTAGWVMLVGGHGVSNGIFILLAAVVWPRYFGRLHLGAITGLNMCIMVFASAVGPVIFAQAHSLTGRYDEIIIGAAVVPLIVLATGLKADNPQSRDMVLSEALVENPRE
jgi:MFS transporter, OFA family, oxalate/formate antiporter